MRRIHLASLIAASSLVLLSSCDFQAQAGERSFGLADEYRKDKSLTVDLEEEEYDAVRGQLKGALEMLCGTPAQPHFLLLPEWVDEGYNPNYPKYARDEDGSGEVAKEELAAGNERVFRLQLEAIAEGDYAGVNPFRGAPVLQRTWEDFLADFTEDGVVDYGPVSDEPIESDDAFRAEARRLLVEWYPSFEDSAELYRLECLHCHGTEGSGDGSTAPFLHPSPRNYQPGIFKWTALNDKARPRRADLHNLITNGAYTSAMPAFRRFSRAQIHGLVDMVRLLAIRGETERLLAFSIHYDVDGDPLTSDLIIETYSDVWGKWDVAAESLITYAGDVPTPTEESIARGREIFMDTETGNCFSCHGDLGLGDGASAWEASPEGLDEDGDGEVDMVRIVDEWGEEIIPRNLTLLDSSRFVHPTIRSKPEPHYLYSSRSYWYPQSTVTDFTLAN